MVGGLILIICSKPSLIDLKCVSILVSKHTISSVVEKGDHHLHSLTTAQIIQTLNMYSGFVDKHDKLETYTKIKLFQKMLENTHKN